MKRFIEAVLSYNGYRRQCISLGIVHMSFRAWVIRKEEGRG